MKAPALPPSTANGGELELIRGCGEGGLGGLCRQTPAAALWCEVSPKVVHDFVREVEKEEKSLQNSTFNCSGCCFFFSFQMVLFYYI